MTSPPPDDADEALQAYLDQLLLALRGRPRDVRRLLTEVEAHLHDAIDAEVAAGAGHADAVRQACTGSGHPPRSPAVCPAAPPTAHSPPNCSKPSCC